MSQETLNIEYIGEKPTKLDTVCHSGTMWVGRGDVQPVPRNIAAKLLWHKEVWRKSGGDIVEPQTPGVPEPKAPTDDTPLGTLLGLGNAPLPAKDPGPDDGAKEAAEEEVEKEVAEDKPVSLVDLLRAMPRDAEHISKMGKPIIAKVRELAGDDSITVEQVKQAWGEVDG